MRSEHSDEHSAEQLQEVQHPEARMAHRGICTSPDTIFGSHRVLDALDYWLTQAMLWSADAVCAPEPAKANAIRRID